MAQGHAQALGEEAVACALRRGVEGVAGQAERRVDAGNYVHNVARYAKFSIRDYHNWLETLDMKERF